MFKCLLHGFVAFGASVWCTASIPPVTSAQRAGEIRSDSRASGTVAAPASMRPGVGLTVGAGLHTGLALGTRLGLGDVGVELNLGYQLLLGIWQNEPERGSGVDADSSAQLGAEAYFTPWHPLESTAIGLKSGYRYNTVLEHGFAIAFTFLAEIGHNLALEGLAGASIFPGSEGRLRRALDIPSRADIVYGSSLQFFEYGFELIWYP